MKHAFQSVLKAAIQKAVAITNDEPPPDLITQVMLLYGGSPDKFTQQQVATELMTTYSSRKGIKVRNWMVLIIKLVLMSNMPNSQLNMKRSISSFSYHLLEQSNKCIMHSTTEQMICNQVYSMIEALLQADIKNAFKPSLTVGNTQEAIQLFELANSLLRQIVDLLAIIPQYSDFQCSMKTLVQLAFKATSILLSVVGIAKTNGFELEGMRKQMPDTRVEIRQLNNYVSLVNKTPEQVQECVQSLENLFISEKQMLKLGQELED